MVPGLYLYRAIYNLGIMSLNVSASWFAAAILIIVALPLGLIFARILTDKNVPLLHLIGIQKGLLSVASGHQLSF
mgnify:CR=1 FL=1